jgi:hypothetical protein
MDGVSFGIVSFSRCYAFLFTGIPFLYCALSSSEIWNLLAAFSVYVFVADSQLELTLFFFVISRELLIIR